MYMCIYNCCNGQALSELTIENEKNKADKELALKRIVDLQNAISRSKEGTVRFKDDEVEKVDCYKIVKL